MHFKLALFTLFAALSLLASANSAAQTFGGDLSINTPVEAEITTPDSELTWTFFALQYDVFSIVVQGADGFDPILVIRDITGEEIVRNDDYNYPNTRDALLEAITMPRTGDYVVAVQGYAGTTGAFTLTLLPGYSVLGLDADMDEGANWRVNTPLSMDASNDLLTLGLEGVQTRSAAPYAAGGTFGDFYAQTSIVSIQGRDGWTVGLALRLQAGERYYAAEVNASGQWRFVLIEGVTLTTIRDWGTHPAIVTGQTSFDLGVLALGDGFDVFYNGQYIGQARDDTLTAPGQVGLTVLTANAFASRVTISADRLLVTRPTLLDGERVFPEQIVGGPPTQIVRELERRGLIPFGGQQPLNVAESFIERQSEGADTFALARGATFTNFALGGTVQLQLRDSGLVGCGLMLRQTGTESYAVAFIDSGGGYGLSEREGQGFTNGFFNEAPEIATNPDNRVLVIVSDEALHYYLNERYVGSMTIDPLAGAVGNAILNYSGVDATCNFADTWLWRW